MGAVVPIFSMCKFCIYGQKIEPSPFLLLGDGDFKIEKVTGRFLRKNKPGPKKIIK